MTPAEVHDSPAGAAVPGDLDHLARAALRPLAQLGPFDILAEAGRGGQGVVYRARPIAGGAVVAVKRLTAARRAEGRLRARFEREWEAARRLDHPGIVRPLGATDVGGEMLIAMEWVDGVTITRWADEGPGGGRREPRACLGAAVAVADALVHAHQRGVIHRDLKPSNILVGADDRPRVLDFGLAKLLDGGAESQDRWSLTGADEAIGTIPYAAPEQVLGGAGDADTRADVYSLGAVLYRMLAGRAPHNSERPLGEVLRAIATEEPARPSAVVPGLGRDLDAVVLMALRRSPADRYQSVDAFRADLLRLLRAEPVLARPPSLREHARAVIGRHRAASACAAGLLVGLTTFGAVSGVLAFRLAGERRAALNAAGESAAAVEFVRDMLASARPTEAGGDATVVGVLRDAAARAETRLAGRPAAGAEVAYTIGYTYRSLWMWEESVPHLERALALAVRAHGPRSEAAARCMVALGTSLSNMGDDRSIVLQRDALAIRRAASRPDAALVAESLMRLGYALHRAARPPRWEEAEACLRDALAMRRAAHGPTHHAVAECLHHLGYLRWRQRRAGEAVALYDEAAAAFRAADAAASPAFAECLTGFASILMQTGEDERAAELYRELVPLTRTLFGRSTTYAPLVSLGAICARAGEAAAASEHYAEAVRVRCAELAARTPEQSLPLTRLAQAITVGPRQAGEARAALEELSDDQRIRLGGALRGMAGCWRAAGLDIESSLLFEALPAARPRPDRAAPSE